MTMNRTEEAGHATARLVLFGDADAADVLARSLDHSGVTGSFGEALRRLSHAGRKTAAAQVAVMAQGLLEIDLDNVLLAAWWKHRELKAAAQRTAANPGSRE